MPAAWANHEFGDVLSSNPHHNDVSTIARAGITTGCAPGLFCPADPVTRQQMGSFLARTLRNVTPVVRFDFNGGNPLDPDTSPIVCQTNDFTPSVQVRAIVSGFVGLDQSGAGELGWWLQLVRSTDGGATWPPITNSHGATTLANDAVANAFDMYQELRTAGTPVRYGLQVLRKSGTADADSYHCEIQALFTYADAGASALGS